MARLAHHAEVAAGILIQHQGELDTAFDVLLDGLDHGNFSIKRHVHDIRAFLWANADTIARFQLDAADYRAFQTRARIKKIFVRRTHAAHHAVHLEQVITRHVFRAFEYFSRLFVDLSHFNLFRVAHRHHAQGENLVDLEAIE